MKNIGFWSKGKKQWFRIGVSISGIIIGICYTVLKMITFDEFTGICTIIGFVAYLIEGLFSNREEREELK